MKFLVYSVLRLLAFLVPLAIMWFFFPIMRELWWLTAIFAALIGMSISIIFLRKPLTAASSVVNERRESREAAGKRSSAEQDADIEDAAIDNTTSDNTTIDNTANDAASDNITNDAATDQS